MARPRSQLETTKDINCEAHKFYGMFKYSFHHLTEVFPECFKSCRIVQGIGGVGTVRQWKYISPGTTELHTCMEKAELLDDEKMLMIFVLYNDEIAAEYPHYKFIIQVTPKPVGCRVKWIVEYEKASGDTADPHHFNDLHEKIIDKVDAYIAANA